MLKTIQSRLIDAPENPSLFLTPTKTLTLYCEITICEVLDMVTVDIVPELDGKNGSKNLKV